MTGSAQVDVCALPVLISLWLFKSDSDYLWGNTAIYDYI